MWASGVALAADPPLSCVGNSEPRSIRAEGVTELVGDLVIACTAGTPTPTGVPLQMINLVAFTQARRNGNTSLSGTVPWDSPGPLATRVLRIVTYVSMPPKLNSTGGGGKSLELLVRALRSGVFQCFFDCGFFIDVRSTVAVAESSLDFTPFEPKTTFQCEPAGGDQIARVIRFTERFPDVFRDRAAESGLFKAVPTRQLAGGPPEWLCRGGPGPGDAGARGPRHAARRAF